MSARRDRDNYAEVRLNDDVHAWIQGDTWRVCKNDQVFAELSFETQRKRRDDLSGRKKYKISTEHEVTLTVRGGYRVEFQAKSLRFYGGEVATVRQILKMFESGHLFDLARLDAWSECKANGATDLQLIEADDVYDWRYDSRTDFENKQMALRQHIELLNSLQS
jgi:hypothetical protein